MIQLIRRGSATAAPTFLALPGMDGSLGSIAPLVEKLSNQREIIVVDYAAETNATLEVLATEIANVAKAEIKGAMDLYGQSIGTTLAPQLASLHGLPVRKVALTGAFTRYEEQTMKRFNSFAPNCFAFLFESE